VFFNFGKILGAEISAHRLPETHKYKKMSFFACFLAKNFILKVLKQSRLMTFLL